MKIALWFGAAFSLGLSCSSCSVLTPSLDEACRAVYPIREWTRADDLSQEELQLFKSYASVTEPDMTVLYYRDQSGNPAMCLSCGDMGTRRVFYFDYPMTGERVVMTCGPY